MWRLLLMAVLSLGGCGWAAFGDDDDDSADGDADADPVTCGPSICLVEGGLWSGAGPALASGRLVLHSAGFERPDRTCGGSLCVHGGFEP